MSWTIATIVEGHGDVAAVPVLLRTLRPMWTIPRPIRVPRARIVKPEILKRYLGIAEAAIVEHGGRGAVLILVDADDDCPAELGPELLDHAQLALPHRCCEVVLPKAEFEAWLIGGVAVEGFSAVASPEAVRDPKGVIRGCMGKYSETVDQPSLTSRIDADAAAATCPSFAKLLRSLTRFDRRAEQ